MFWRLNDACFRERPEFAGRHNVCGLDTVAPMVARAADMVGRHLRWQVTLEAVGETSVPDTLGDVVQTDSVRVGAPFLPLEGMAHRSC